jgi:hypothetical protein
VIEHPLLDFDYRQRRVIYEDLFDQFIHNSFHFPIHAAFEPMVKSVFNAEKVILWIDNPDLHLLIAPSHDICSSIGFDSFFRELSEVKRRFRAEIGFTRHHILLENNFSSCYESQTVYTKNILWFRRFSICLNLTFLGP